MMKRHLRLRVESLENRQLLTGVASDGELVQAVSETADGSHLDSVLIISEDGNEAGRQGGHMTVAEDYEPSDSGSHDGTLIDVIIHEMGHVSDTAGQDAPPNHDPVWVRLSSA